MKELLQVNFFPLSDVSAMGKRPIGPHSARNRKK